ncbi:MAG: hypothetical protein J6573_07540 [Lactobacillus sp.]|nr:hypothetical protein [Lactobacillus sp.]
MNKLSQFIIASAKRDKKNIKAIKTKDKLLTPDAFGQVDLSNLEPADNHDSGNNDSNIPSGGVIPDSGMNTDPGKSLSGVEQLWIGPASIASPTDVTLSKTISAVGDGIQLAVQIIKTPITNGQSESTVTLPAVAATDAKPQTGKYVCSVPIPISILAKNLAVGKTINVALDGIGEALSTTKVSQSPVISIYVKDNKTLTITNHQGYALDKTTSGNTGAFYDGQITSVNSYTKVQPIPQLANGTILFSGSVTDGEIKLTGVNDSWSNIADGILVYFSDKIPVGNNYAKLSDCVKFNNPLLINKEQLKKGNSIGLASKHPSAAVTLYTPAGKTWNSASLRAYQISPSDAIPSGFEGAITINSSSINLISGTFDFDGHGAPDSSAAYTGYSIVKVTAYTK